MKKHSSRNTNFLSMVFTNYRAWVIGIAALVVIAVLVSFKSQTTITEATGTIPTDPNLKVAFLADSGTASGSDAVLNLVKNEGAAAVIHIGDFDYASNPTSFKNNINAVLGASFPYFYVMGNHDVDDDNYASWGVACSKLGTTGCYMKDFTDRMNAAGVVIDTTGGGDLNKGMYTAEFRGLKIVSVGTGDFDISASGIGNAVYAPYISTKLSSDEHIWKICTWHEAMQYMQLGDKGNAMGWGVYDTCRQTGAIIAAAHEHSYHRTKTMANFQQLLIDPAYVENRFEERVEPGKSFMFISGLGGNSIRSQTRCTPTTYPYGQGPGCNNIWANAWTSSQGATTTGNAGYGALFIEFNINGDPNRAHAYFKTVGGQIVDDFFITTGAAGASPGPSSTPEVSPTGLPVASVSPTPLASPRPTPTATPRPSATATPLPSGNSVTLNPIADSYVEASNPTKNNGTANLISSDGSPVKALFMKYDLTSLAGKTIVSAKLRMRTQDVSSSVQRLYYVSNSSWTETGINYNNRPLMTTQLATFTPNKRSVWVESTVTSTVQAGAGAPISFGIDSAGTDGYDSNSRETTNKPQLVVTWQ